MSIKRGIVTELSSTSARPIEVKSTLPIGLVLTSDVTAGIYCFDSPRKALESDVFKDHTKGNLKKYLKVGVDKFNVVVPTIISVANEVDDAAQTKTNVINAINALKRASTTANLASSKGAMVRYKPDVIAVGDHAQNDNNVTNAMITVAEALKARCFKDLDAESNSEALTQRAQFGSERLTVAKTSFTDWNTSTNATDEYDSGVVLAWLRTSVDGSSKTGYAKSISNRVVPFSGVKVPSDFIPGALDETDPLTENQITSFIEYDGLRVWEYASCSVDAIWQDARRLRIFDQAADAVLKGIFFAVDKDLGALSAAKDSLRGFMNGLVGDDVMLGFDIYLDEERTTKERITAGEFYFVIDVQEVPSPRLICVRFNRTDKYASVVYETLAAA